ncbi:retrovirus-related Pol polyprotein from transposon 412 [Trichonephila clavipes]|nr:retrovirus-related Pol polyprotein from transposon 412 [Trichonephila clavipes]
MFLFLVDTGSDVSLLPALEYHKRHPPQLTLFAANSSTINVYGQKTLSLDLNVRREFIWTFLLASVKTPILGADFLHYFELVPDLRHKCLRDLKTKLQTTGHIKQAELHSVKTISSHETLYHDLLKSYPSITRLPDPTQPIKHNTVHFIKTNGPPVVAKPRRLAPDRLAIAKSEFQQMMQLGHLRPSSSNYASPLHMVPKRALSIGDLWGITKGIKIKKKTRSTVPQPTEQLQWNDAADAAFRLAKNAIAEAALLRHPIPGASLSIWVDASDVAIGGTLMQLSKNQWEPIAFFSMKLNKSQQKWSTYDRELFSIYSTIRKFRYMLEELKPCQISDHNLICDTSTGTPRPFVPTTFRKLIFEHLHNLSHPGIAATTKLICSRYVWPCMKKQIKTWVRGCDKCQRSKVQRHTKSPLGTFSTPDARFSHIHIDIVGPLPPSDGFQYLLTMIDRFSRWPEAVPIPDTTAKTISRAIFHHWIARFGCPSLITTDQGSQMRSSLFAEFTRILGTDRVKTTAYHPISNGLVERFHRHLKASIKAHESSRWTDVLPIVLLGIRSAVKEDLKASCAELVYGTTLRLPSDMLNVSIIPPCDEEFITSLRNIMRHLNPVATSTHGHSAHFVHPALSSCTHVFLRIDKVSPPLTQPYTGPHEVIARTDKTLQIIINSKPSWVSIDRVKPAFVSQDFDFPRAPKINTALKDITTSPKTVSEGQKQFSSSSKCLPSTTSTRTRSGRQLCLIFAYFADKKCLLSIQFLILE